MKNISFKLSYTASELRLRSHWITFSIFISVTAGLSLATYLPIWGGLFSIILFLFMIGLENVSSSASHGIYTIIRKITVRFCKVLSSFILFVIYYGFIWPMSFTGSKFDTDCDEAVQTGWKATNTGGKQENAYSLGSFYQWINNSGDLWLIFIYPYLLLLRLYGSNPARRSVPEDTYTLY